MASLWFNILTVITFRSMVLQARDATLDIKALNILGLIEDLKRLRNQWDGIVAVSKLVAEGYGVVPSLKLTDTKRKRRRIGYTTRQNSS